MFDSASLNQILNALVKEKQHRSSGHDGNTLLKELGYPFDLVAGEEWPAAAAPRASQQEQCAKDPFSKAKSPAGSGGGHIPEASQNVSRAPWYAAHFSKARSLVSSGGGHI